MSIRNEMNYQCYHGQEKNNDDEVERERERKSHQSQLIYHIIKW